MIDPRPLRRRHLLQLVLLGAGGTAAAWLLRQSAPVGRAVGDLAAAREVLADATVPTSASPGADLTLAVFSDYRCPVCRLAYPAMRAAAGRDGRIRLAFFDWPVFGGISIRAAQVALAAARQGRYDAVHHGLMTDPRALDDAVLADIARSAGADLPRLAADLRDHIDAIDRRLARTARQALALGLPGTPGYLIGPRLVLGALDEPGFIRAFAQARATAPAISAAAATG